MIFALLGFCYRAAYPNIKLSIYFQVLLGYSILTEILQGEMELGRSMEFWDLIADTIGFVLGYLLFKSLRSTNI